MGVTMFHKNAQMDAIMRARKSTYMIPYDLDKELLDALQVSNFDKKKFLDIQNKLAIDRAIWLAKQKRVLNNEEIQEATR